MSKKYPGLYLYFDWLDALEKLSPEKAMKIIVNLRRFAESNTEPEEIQGPESLIQNIMLAQLKRSKQTAESAEKSYKHRTAATALISDTVQQDELDREANDEEKQMWKRLAEKSESTAPSDEVRQTIERARSVLRDLKIG